MEAIETIMDKNLLEEVRAGLKVGSPLHYVPIQKLTLAVLSLALDRYCGVCRENTRDFKRSMCEECEFKTAREYLVWSIQAEPFFDENFKLIPPSQKTEEVKK